MSSASSLEERKIKGAAMATTKDEQIFLTEVEFGGRWGGWVDLIWGNDLT